jgi:hypothetical protein
MTNRELRKRYGAFFRAEGLVTKRCYIGPNYVIVIYEGCQYYVVLDIKRNHDGMCFRMFTYGPEFVSWDDECWENHPVGSKVRDAANKVNARHTLGRVHADYSAVTYRVDIRLQSPEQFKDFFYKAVRALKAVEQDFIEELQNIGVFWKPSSEPCETGERIIGELCAKQGFISGSDGKSCLKALGDNDTLKVEYCVYEEGFKMLISHYRTGISKAPEAEPGSAHTISFFSCEFPLVDEAVDRVREGVADAVAFEEAWRRRGISRQQTNKRNTLSEPRP